IEEDARLRLAEPGERGPSRRGMRDWRQRRGNQAIDAGRQCAERADLEQLAAREAIAVQGVGTKDPEHLSAARYCSSLEDRINANAEWKPGQGPRPQRSRLDSIREGLGI